MRNYPVEETAGYLIYRVGRLFRYKAAAFFERRGLEISPEQWGLLLKIAEHGPAPLSGFVDPVLSDHPNVTRMVRGLEKLGYVRKIPNQEDKRSHLVDLTPQGETLINDILPDLIEEKARFFDGLSDREIGWLITILKAVESNLEG